MSSYYTNGTMVLGKTYLIRRKRRKTVQNIQKTIGIRKEGGMT